MQTHKKNSFVLQQFLEYKGKNMYYTFNVVSVIVKKKKKMVFNIILFVLKPYKYIKFVLNCSNQKYFLNVN